MGKKLCYGRFTCLIILKGFRGVRVYTCGTDWVSMLTTIYEAWSCGIGHANIRLEIEPVMQMTLFDEYIHVNPDNVKAEKVMDSVICRISSEFYHCMATTAMAYESDALDNIYHMLILGFAYGPDIIKDYRYKDVVRNIEIRSRVTREADKFREFLRFHQIGNVYVAHFEPRSRVAEFLGVVFQDRMPSENFIIVDDVHRDAVFHNANEPFYMMRLSEDELTRMLKTEEENDEFTDLWKAFFDTIAIKERTNPRCQMALSPLWQRKHMVEFTK